MDALPIVWFVAIAVLWTGYILLEGFDLGVGMHMLFSARDDKDRRVMLNTIGPVWDGNEVWLLTAGAGTFAAFPLWYASLFSTLYIPLVLVLLGLILRAVAIEYRGKLVSRSWTRFWDWSIGLGSAVVAFGLGAGLALTTTGLPINENGDRVGGPFVWLTPVAILGGLALVGFCLVHGATFLALKTDGPVRERMGRLVPRLAPIALLPIAGWAILVELQGGGNPLSWTLLGLAVVAGVLGWFFARSRREGRAFTGFAAFGALGAGSIFAAVFPVVLPSTIDTAYDLTIWNAASGTYTLTVMTVVTAVALPIVLAYQAWSYWVFRKRIAPHHLPEAHDPVPAVRTTAA
ncbi:cytochrome d ubiquinol oxidase subunit II [Homoserinibacter sp. GY 40078]|uniref:cytochrome d ubiquinol oxidase subunit II n=1 Tax=Homoserinibacter sp. GY 40078 TaxID=2603275 RepID=UPI0011CC4488|nr:cytochrome d ubiquinol oxidase subunit II [Homoserinibacter sp. GY 40078]TXK19678.1 cytochrome d ubiquinol oxidase subunit II [Homoserinibacter sp. GY 40078]